MSKWDEVFLITFITCDVIIENNNGIKNFYNFIYKNLKVETKDILGRLFK